MKHYHVKTSGISDEPHKPLITIDKALAEKTYGAMVRGLIDNHHLVTRFSGKIVTQFQTGETVSLLTCYDESCKINA